MTYYRSLMTERDVRAMLENVVDVTMREHPKMAFSGDAREKAIEAGLLNYNLLDKRAAIHAMVAALERCRVSAEPGFPE